MPLKLTPFYTITLGLSKGMRSEGRKRSSKQALAEWIVIKGGKGYNLVLTEKLLEKRYRMPVTYSVWQQIEPKKWLSLEECYGEGKANHDCGSSSA